MYTNTKTENPVKNIFFKFVTPCNFVMRTVARYKLERQAMSAKDNAVQCKEACVCGGMTCKQIFQERSTTYSKIKGSIAFYIGTHMSKAMISSTLKR